MTLGPLEYTVIGFAGNNFRGEIADEIGRVIDSGIIAVVDAALIIKDVDGDAAIIEFDNKEDPRFEGFAGLLEGMTGLLTPEDLEAIADTLPADSAGLVILFEHRWAVRIKEAIGNAGGFVISRETIAPEALEMVNKELESGTLSLE